MSPEDKNRMNLQEHHSDKFEDAAVRRLRLLRIGVRNKDQITLDAVKDDLVKEFGEVLGPKVYDNLLFFVSSDINIEDIKEQYGIDLKHLQ